MSVHLLQTATSVLLKDPTAADPGEFDPTDPESGLDAINFSYACPLYTSYPNHLERQLLFSLMQQQWDRAEAACMNAAQTLASLPTVQNFECLRQVSPKNDFDFGFSMEFESKEGYEAYNIHPEHVRFVETRWKPEVADFLEIDYVPFVPD